MSDQILLNRTWKSCYRDPNNPPSSPVEDRAEMATLRLGPDGQLIPPVLPPSADGKHTWQMRQPSYPEFRYEWHPGVRKVYCIRLGRDQLRANMVADNVETHGQAITAMWIHIRGIEEERTDSEGKRLQE